MMAENVYRLLLRLYPRSFRVRFEAAMCETFVEDHARARAAGLRQTIAFWIRATAEAITYGMAERFTRADRADVIPIQSKGRSMTSGFLHDSRDAFRALRATPLITTVAVLSLALGIGANTALFSILNGLVLKPLSVRDPGALMLLDDGEWTNPIWEEIRARQHALFDGAFAWSGTRFNLSAQGPTDFVSGAYASGGIFDVLGVHATLGRLFSAQDDIPGGGRDGAVAVISDRFWKGRFNGASDVVGRRLSLEGIPFTVIGVMPADFFGPDVGNFLDVVIPLADESLIHGAASQLPGRSTWWLEIMARRKPGQSIEQANAALRGVQPHIRNATLPQSARGRDGYLAEAFTMIPAAQGFSRLRTRYQQPLTIIMVVVGVVLLMACVNIASLLLARAVARRYELVIRLALGASRWRLARTLLLESGMLACGGAALGLVVARVSGTFLVRQLATPGHGVFLDLTLDGRVMAFTAAVAMLTALIFGLAPALGVSRATPIEVLKQQSRSLMGDRRWSARNALVVAQVALSLALLVGAGLFVRTFAALIDQPLGMSVTPLIAVDINVQRSQAAPSARLPLFDRFKDAASSTPGVLDAALSNITPIEGSGWNTVIAVDGAPPLPERQRLSWVNAISPRFFSTYGLTLVAGRDFTDGDGNGGQLVAIVNEAFARKFFAGGDPVGREFHRESGRPGTSTNTYRIVGLASDAVYRRLREGMVPTLYVPLASQTPLGASIALTLRTTPGARGAMTAALARVLGSVDGTAALTIRPFDDYLGAAVAQERLVAILSGFFGGLALMLAALGLYGVTSYTVNRRRTEIGVRMALGAEPSGIVHLVLGRVGSLVAAGVIAGAGLSWWASRYISASLLYGVTARDASTVAGAVVMLACVSAFAGWLPARRASRIDPAESLRDA
jgi:predicted permease